MTAERSGQRQDAPGDRPRPSRPGHFRADIEGLRAIAVGLVLLDHVFGWPSGGFIGVDVFFVISGFLITGLLVRERARTGRISFRAFYVRRARRLMPAAVATLAVTALASWLLFLDGRFRQTVTDELWALFFGANVHFAQLGTDYFQQSAAPSPVQHFWSLAVEEQFYLVWPALILLVFAVPLGRRNGRTTLLVAAMALVTLASFAWSVHATATSPATAYFSTFTRAWELGVGALIAVAADRLLRLPARLRVVLAWLGLFGVVLSAFVISSTDPFPGTLALLPVASTGLLVAFGGQRGGPGTRWVLGSPPARFLGRISYSLYLWHWPVVVVCLTVFEPGSITGWSVALGVSLLLATVSYHAVEQPVMHSRWLLPGGRTRARDPRAAVVFRRGRLVAGVAAALVVVVGSGLTLAFPPGRLDPQAVAAVDAALRAQAEDGGTSGVASDPLTQQIQLSTQAMSWPEDTVPALDQLPGYLEQQWSDGCFDVGAWNVSSCSFGEADAAHRAVVLGDSIAGAYLPGLTSTLLPQGWSVQTLTMGQCPNIDALTLYKKAPFQACADHRDWALQYIAETRPELVVLSDTYDTELADATADKATVWRQGLTTVVREAQQSGARVVLLTAPPAGANLQTCATTLSAPTDCVQSVPRRFTEQRAIEQQVAADTGATHVDPERWFCVDGRCPAVVGTTPVFADGLHMTAEYAERIGDQLAAAVLPVS